MPTTAASVWPSINGSVTSGRRGGFLSQSNVLDGGVLTKPAAGVRDLAELLEGIDGLLRQHSELLRHEEIDLSVFLAMFEEDLRLLGVRTVGQCKSVQSFA